MNVPKQELEILNKTSNVLNYGQATINTYLIDEYDRNNILRTIKLLIHRMDHFSVDLISKKLDKHFSDLDFVNFVKYPLPATYNIKTGKPIVNLKFFGKKEVTNIDSRALYAVIFYAYLLKLFALQPLKLETQIAVSDFMGEFLIKMFGKKYGIMASYTDMIPKLRFVTIAYILTSFYGLEQSTTYSKANRAGISIKDFNIDFDSYDLYNTRDFIKLLSDTGAFPGINLSEFVSNVIKRYSIIALPMFEDEMRFMATLGAATMPSGGLFPPYLDSVDAKLHHKIISTIQQFI